MATGTMGRTPVLVARIGITLHRIRTTTLGCGVPVSILVNCYINATALYADQIRYGQPFLPASANTLMGSGCP